MSSRQYFSYIVYLFAFVGFISVFQNVYQRRNQFLPVLIIGTNQKLSVSFNKNNLATTNVLLKHIEQCPECVLFLFQNQNLIDNQTIFSILNNIPVNSQTIFYPLTMKLHYNQPLPYYTILSNNQTEIRTNIRRGWLDQIEKIDRIKTDSILYFILQSLKTPTETNDYTWPNKTKLILYYTKFFGNTYWYNKDENEVYSNDFNKDSCPISVNACRVTIDQKLFSESDASLIHLRESINYDRLNNLSRRSSQKLVFFIKESPVHSPTLSPERHGRIFNYTQTYRPDSDVTATTLRNFFWLFDHIIYPDYDFKSILDTKKPDKILVAVVSNCGGLSNRLSYINELKQYISVDVYGKCGRTCPNVPDCRQHVYSTYKFYLSFENSLCDEYVTEKFFYALHSARIIPVVLGWARYNHYIPSSGYIDVRNFTSPRELASHIDYLNRNTTAYLEYFQWRQYALHIKLPKYMCELCLKLFLDDKDQKRQALEHIDQYWNKKRQCHTYTKDKNGIWIMK
jgi:alpha-1,3-fucosyltransferase